MDSISKVGASCPTPRAKFHVPAQLLCTTVRRGRGLTRLRAEADLPTRRIRTGKLLHQIIYPALDLLDVDFRLVHARFELVDATHVRKTLKEHIAKRSGRPFAKANTLYRLDTVSDGDDDIQIVNRQRSASTINRQILPINRIIKFFFRLSAYPFSIPSLLKPVTRFIVGADICSTR